MSDHAALLAAARAGDGAALGELVRLHRERVYRYGVRVCAAADVDDAVQEAFVTLGRSVGQIERAESLLPWLRRVVERACLHLLEPLLRRRRALGEPDPEALDDAPADAPDPEQALARWRLVEAVHRALAGLPADLREVLVLRDLEGLSGPETARALELTEEAMKSRLHRARARLREALRAAGADAS